MKPHRVQRILLSCRSWTQKQGSKFYPTGGASSCLGGVTGTRSPALSSQGVTWKRQGPRRGSASSVAGWGELGLWRQLQEKHCWAPVRPSWEPGRERGLPRSPGRWCCGSQAAPAAALLPGVRARPWAARFRRGEPQPLSGRQAQRALCSSAREMSAVHPSLQPRAFLVPPPPSRRAVGRGMRHGQRAPAGTYCSREPPSPHRHPFFRDAKGPFLGDVLDAEGSANSAQQAAGCCNLFMPTAQAVPDRGEKSASHRSKIEKGGVAKYHTSSTAQRRPGRFALPEQTHPCSRWKG